MSKLQLTGMTVGFDATTSGIQLLSLATNDIKGMEMSNVVNSYDKHKVVRRRDAYLDVTEEMYKYVDRSETILKPKKKDRRKQVKHTVMTFFYGSTKKPKDTFGKGSQDYLAFYHVMQTELEGPYKLMQLMQLLWDDNAEHYTATLPNGSVAYLAVLDKFTGTLKLTVHGEERNIKYQTTVKRPYKDGLSMAANVTHMCDGFIKDKVVMHFKRINKPVWTIHDEFRVHPNDVNELKKAYTNALVLFYQEKVLQGILRQISGDNTLVIPQISDIDYTEKIRNNTYSLS